MIYTLVHIKYNWRVLLGLSLASGAVMMITLTCIAFYFLGSFLGVESFGGGLAGIPLYVGGIVLGIFFATMIGVFVFLSAGTFLYNLVIVRMVGGLKVEIRFTGRATMIQ